MRITAKTVGGKPMSDRKTSAGDSAPDLIERLDALTAELHEVRSACTGILEYLTRWGSPVAPDYVKQEPERQSEEPKAPAAPASEQPASRVERMFGKRETWISERGDHAASGRTPVKGFLHLKCPGCGNQFTTFLKEPKDFFYCRDCGTKIPLDLPAMRKFSAACNKCGDRPITYRTNSNEDVIAVSCRNCGAEIDGMLHKLRDEYVTI